MRGLTVNAKDIIIKQPSDSIYNYMLSRMAAYTRFIQDSKDTPKFREINITMISIYNDDQVNEICRVSPWIIFLQLFELLHDM